LMMSDNSNPLGLVAVLIFVLVIGGIIMYGITSSGDESSISLPVGVSTRLFTYPDGTDFNVTYRGNMNNRVFLRVDGYDYDLVLGRDECFSDPRGMHQWKVYCVRQGRLVIKLVEGDGSG